MRTVVTSHRSTSWKRESPVSRLTRASSLKNEGEVDEQPEDDDFLNTAFFIYEEDEHEETYLVEVTDAEKRNKHQFVQSSGIVNYKHSVSYQVRSYSGKQVAVKARTSLPETWTQADINGNEVFTNLLDDEILPLHAAFDRHPILLGQIAPVCFQLILLLLLALVLSASGVQTAAEVLAAELGGRLANFLHEHNVL